MDNEEEKKKKNYSYGIQLSHRSLILTHFHGTLWSKPHGRPQFLVQDFAPKTVAAFHIILPTATIQHAKMQIKPNLQCLPTESCLILRELGFIQPGKRSFRVTYL